MISFLSNEIIFNKRGLVFSASSSAKALISTYHKQRFLEKELPIFCSSLVLLDISIEDSKARYNEFLSKDISVEVQTEADENQ